MKTYLQYLEEKDHRAKMLKFGIPEVVADYLHNLNDKYSIWFANQFKQMPEFQQATDKIDWIRTKSSDITGILDWVSNATSIRLPEYDWKGAIMAYKEWVDINTQKASGTFSPEANIPKKCCGGSSAAPEHYPTFVKSYSDGYYWVNLNTTYCALEAAKMQHCGKTDIGTEMYSLRSEDGEPHVTIAFNPDEGFWNQAKGKQNTAPDEMYNKYIANILAEEELFEYRNEYQRDFNADDFRNYVEEHPDEFKDPDAIASKIGTNYISLDEFQQVIDGTHLQFMDISIDELDNYDDAPELYSRGSAYISFPFSEISPNLKDVNVNLHDTDWLLEAINTKTGIYFNELEVEVQGKSIALYLNIEEYETFPLTPDGLESFTQYVERTEDEDSNINIDEILAITQVDFASSEVISTPYTEIRDDIFEKVEAYKGIHTLECEEEIDDYIDLRTEITATLDIPEWEDLMRNDAIRVNSHSTIYSEDEVEIIRNEMRELRSMDNPLYYLYEHVSKALETYTGVILRFSGYRHAMEFTYNVSHSDVDDADAKNMYTKNINDFFKNIDSIAMDIKDIVETKISPVCARRHQMTYDDVDVSQSDRAYHIKYRGHIIKYIHKRSVKSKSEVIAIVNKELETENFLVYPPPPPTEHPDQMTMKFESSYFRKLQKSS